MKLITELRKNRYFSPLYLSIILAIATSIISGYSTIAQAQITSSLNDAETVVNQDGNTFNITGGTQADQNLFHGFEKFGLDPGQTANFLSNPTIQNILGRVTGGDVSVINGLIQVSGSNANLYLINAAGIIFGPNASLNVPASFTATTANGIGFGDKWFSAIGKNNYTNLVENPDNFAFTQSGTIFNAGNLAVGSGQNLTLLGGTVLSTGTISAPGGKVTIAAVPEEKLVSITPEGSLLSLNLPLETKSAINPQSFTPLLLPQLLTGGNITEATGVTVENSIVKLTGSGLAIPTNPGIAVVTNKIDVSAVTGGSVNILGQKVGLVGANINASGTNDGGTVLVGGDYKGQGTVPNSTHTLVDENSIISADALENGNGGRVITWADNITGFLGNISARGGSQSGNGGFVEVSGKENLIFQGIVDVGASNGVAGSILLDPRNITILSDDGDAAPDAFLNSNNRILAGDFTNSDVTISEDVLESLTGNVTLEATNEIFIYTEDTKLNFQAGTGEKVRFSAGKRFETYSAIATQGGAIEITAPEEIRFRFSSEGLFTNGGNITLNGPVAATLDLNLNAGTGKVQLNNAIKQVGYDVNITGSSIQAGSIASQNGDIKLNGATTLTGGKISSLTGNITFNGSTTLTGDTTFDNNTFFVGGYGSDGDITFNGTIDGNRNLKIESRGHVSFNNNVGSNIPLASLDVLNQFGKTFLGGNIITNGGDIKLNLFSNPLILTNDVIISTGETVGGNIKIDNYKQGINSDSVTPRNLTLIAGQGNVDVRSYNPSRPLRHLSISGNNITANGGVNTTGDLVVNAKNDLNISNGQYNTGGEIYLNANRNLNIKSSTLTSSGDMQLIAGDTVNIQDNFDSNDADKGEFIAKIGNNLLIQGNNAITIQATNNPLSVIQANGDITLRSNGLITGNARFINDGNFAVFNLANEPGIFKSDIQTLISSTGDVNFGDYEGFALKVESQGNIIGGNIKITGRNATLAGSDSDITILNHSPALILRAGKPLANAPQTPSKPIGGTTFSSTAEVTKPANIQVKNINAVAEINDFLFDRGPVILDATGSVTTGEIEAGAVDVASVGDIKTGGIRTVNSGNSQPQATGNVTLTSTEGNVVVDYISAFVRGNVTVNANGVFQAQNAKKLSFSPSSLYDTPVSIVAVGKVDIKHGGESFTAGLGIERDANGQFVFRIADGPKQGTQVFIKPDTSSSRRFVFADGTLVNSDKVTIFPVALDKNSISPNASYTDGAIFISGGINGTLYGSYQDTELTRSSNIGIVSVPRPPFPINPSDDTVVNNPDVNNLGDTNLGDNNSSNSNTPDGQIVQRQLNNAEKNIICPPETIITIALEPRNNTRGGEQRKSNNDPCQPIRNQGNILQIIPDNRTQP